MISKQSIAEILLNEITDRENNVGNIRCMNRIEKLSRIEIEQELHKANCKIEILEGLLRLSDDRYRKERERNTALSCGTYIGVDEYAKMHIVSSSRDNKKETDNGK